MSEAIDDLTKRIQELESEKEALRFELWKHQRKPVEKIGYLLLFLGFAALATSIFSPSSYNPQILAFTGLGLTFWGALILFIKSTPYVKNKILDNTVLTPLLTINQIINELNYQGRGIYLPPQSLKGLKGGMLYIPSKNEIVIPKVGELTEGKIFQNAGGLCLTSPGFGLMALYEKELGVDFSKVDLNYIQRNLPKLLIEDLEILEDFEINQDGNTIHIKMTGSTFKDLKLEESTNLYKSIGCPLCGSIACLLAKAIGKPLIIEKIDKSPDEKVTEIQYRIIEA